jgi:tetratricopeptide (TPR) repeat protein
MHLPVLRAAIVLALIPAVAPAQGESPRAIELAAERAVEGDSVRAVAARWEARLRRDAGDRAASFGLATLARLRYAYADAERRYGALIAGSPDGYTARAHLGMALGWDARGQSRAMRPHLDRALTAARSIGDEEAEGQTLVTRALDDANTVGVDAGLAVLDTAERLLRGAAPDLRAELLRRRAVMLAVLQRPGASELAARAHDLARQSGRTRVEARALRAAGTVLMLGNRNDSALVTLRAAEALYRRAQARDELALTLMFRVGSELQRGALGEAKAALDEAIASATAAQDEFSVASARLAAGVLATRVRDYTTAIAQLERAAAQFGQLADSGSIAIVQQQLATVQLATGDAARARASANAALRRHRRIGERRMEFEGLQLLAAIAAHERDWTGAARSLAEARDMLRRGEQLPEWRASLLNTESRIALARGQLDEAERLTRDFLAGRDSAQHAARYQARMRLADVHARRGDAARAEREAMAAADELERWRATLSDEELRVRVFEASPWDDNDGGASVARVLGAMARAGRAEAALTLAERRRARELLDRLALAAALRAGHDTATAANGGARRPGRPLRADELLAALPDRRTALVQYVVGPQGAPTTAFVLTRGRDVHAVAAPPVDSLAPLVARLRALMESGSDPAPLARRLGAALLDATVAALPADVDRLVIVPDGALHNVPFDALQLADSRFVLERFAVSLAPSASVAAAAWRTGATRDRGTMPLRLLALGDPVFAGAASARDDGDQRDVLRSAFTEAGGLPRLEASGREARRVARYAPDADLRLRDAASAAFLKRAPLERYRVIHLATHALVDDRTVARTALALAPGDGEDGFLGAGDLVALRLSADLVVLSACRTAGGVVVGGEGIQGLTAPLLQAGARAVVATRWPIGDRSTLALVDDFYAALARGLAAGDALRAAKLAALRRGAPASEWAAFTLVGDPHVRVPLVVPSAVAQARTWATAGTLALLVAALVTFLVRGRASREPRPGASARMPDSPG